jgi:hypothetical protein
VDHHVEFLAGNFLLARLVEMELDQRVRFAIDGDAVAGCVVDLNRVAVVDDFERRRLIIELDRCKVLFRTLDVDRGLPLARLAGCVVGLKIAQCDGPSPPE